MSALSNIVAASVSLSCWAKRTPTANRVRLDAGAEISRCSTARISASFYGQGILQLSNGRIHTVLAAHTHG